MYSLVISRGYPSLSVNLNDETGSNTTLLRYIPSTPSLDDKGAVRDVAEQLVFKYSVDTSTPSSQLAGEANARSVVRNLNRIFTSAQLARKRRSKKGRAVIRFQVRQSDAEFYAEIHSGYAAFSSFSSNYYEITVSFIREPYLTSSTEQQLPINNSTSAVEFLNKGNNSYSLDASSLSGDMPSPIRLEMTLVNTTNSSEVFAGIHVGSSSWSGKLEAESGSVPFGADCPVTAVSGSSNGNVRRCTVLSYPDQNGLIPISSYKIIEWSLSPSDVASIDGRRMKPFLRLFSSFPVNDLQFAVSGSHQYITASPYKYWVELPSIAIPSQSVIGSSSDDGESFKITLYARKMSSVNQSVDVDFICFVPLDLNRRYKCSSFLQNQTLHDDPYEDVSYVRTTDTPPRRISSVVPIGHNLLVYPGESHRITIVQDGLNTDYNDPRSLTVKAYARPRRFNL